ncbi:hypothetical protein LEP1GSC193_2022 [Leptospira alstonii serovar Pingchang str. 80-412]|uniref:Uncharacterized protein n=2 Tax=Leptospira alstonii TaxID=28452 RepID=M6CZZ4_9LEPT|nr:hypothetical protein LEP1GSC194_0575 [Leptospira alstonii serovar Sichuan str. 79601]EQA79774.1 hypothetical protein LEP1GSC193_2022 [Leptospira alstonii serovar Pingchang str. 80-412]
MLSNWIAFYFIEITKTYFVCRKNIYFFEYRNARKALVFDF